MMSFLARRKKRRKVLEVHLLNNVNHRKLVTSRRKSLNKTGRLSSLFLLKERGGVGYDREIVLSSTTLSVVFQIVQIVLIKMSYFQSFYNMKR